MPQREQAPTRSHSWPRVSIVVRRRFRIRVVHAWELERCACLAPWRVLPIFKSFDPDYCEHVHRCWECLKPSKSQTPTADELVGKKRRWWMFTDALTKKALRQ